MKTVTDIRLENFKKIAALYKSQREFADVLGESTGYVNQLLHGKRGIGEKVARKFEEKLRMSHLSLDVDSVPVTLIDGGDFGDAVKAVEVTPEELSFINLLRDATSMQRKNAFEIFKGFRDQNKMAFAELGHRYGCSDHSHA